MFHLKDPDVLFKGCHTLFERRQYSIEYINTYIFKHLHSL